MTNKTELLPCPFCGSTEVKTVVDDGLHFEQCLKCEATGPTGFKRGEEDDSNWNTRAPAEDVRAVVEEPLALGWTLGDYQMNQASTTYDPSVADQWERAGYPVEPFYRHPQRSVVLPARVAVPAQIAGLARKYAEGFNACLDAVEQLNRAPR